MLVGAVAIIVITLRDKLISQSDYDDSYSTYKQDKALLEQYKVTVSELTIVAPISGVISKTDYHVGDLLEANSTIATLYDPDHLSITYQLPASKRSTYKLGQIVDVVSELNPGKKSEGTVSSPYLQISCRDSVLTPHQQSDLIYRSSV